MIRLEDQELVHHYVMIKVGLFVTYENKTLKSAEQTMANSFCNMLLKYTKPNKLSLTSSLFKP